MTEADLAPIVAFELNLVGRGGAQTATFSSGSGTITYAAGQGTPLTVLNEEPACTETHDVTGEKGNSFYGELPAGPGTSFTQSFTTSTERPMIHRPGTRVLRLIR